MDGNTGTKHVVHAAGISYLGEFAINTNGNRIAARAGNGNLYKITVGGGESQYSSRCSASVSPNGNYVTQNDDGHRSMTIFNWGGGTYKTLNSNSYGWDNQRFVANDNDYIVYMYDHNDHVRDGVGMVRVSSGAITHICDVPGQWGEAHPDFFVGSLPTPPAGNTAPSASISQPADGATFAAGATVNYSGSATDAEDGSLSGSALSWELDRVGDGLGPVHTSTGTTGSYTFPTNITSRTTYYLNLTATDSGGMSDTDSITVYVDPVTTNDPPTANLAAGPTSGDAPLTVGFNANSSDPDGNTLTHEWDWNYPGTFSADLNSGADATVSNTYTTAGSFTAAVRVSDGNGHTVLDTVSITVTTPTNTAPTAAITQPGDCQYYLPGDTMNYAGSGADAEDGAIPGSGLSWAIDRVGDGQTAVHTSTGATGSYTFPTDIVSSTRYYVDLTATDSGGLTHTVRIDVFIEPQAPNMPPAVNLTASPASGNARST